MWVPDFKRPVFGLHQSMAPFGGITAIPSVTLLSTLRYVFVMIGAGESAAVLVIMDLLVGGIRRDGVRKDDDRIIY